MITKRQMIDLIQNRLSGGDTPLDVRKMYPRSVISRVLNFAFADEISRDPYSFSDMSPNYTFTPVTDTNGYYVTLNPLPISGTLSIYTVTDGAGNDYIPQSKAEANAMKTLRSNNNQAAILFGDKLRFNKKPSGDVVVNYIPNIYQMADDDILIVPANEDGRGETKVFAMCLQVLQSPQYQDELNNNNIDAQRNGN